MAYVRRIALAALAAALLTCHRGTVPPSALPAPPAPEPKAAPKTVTLFFLHPETGDLAPALATISLPDDPAEKARQILALLVAGPKDSPLVSPLPDGTSLRAVYLSGPTLVADFGLPAEAPPLEGSRSELAFAYAVTNTVCLNLSDIKGVRLLINDSDETPLLTHLSLRLPFTPKIQ